MYYTGIDLHKKTSFLTTIDQSGNVVTKKNIKNDPKLIMNYFHQLDQKPKVVIESTASWYWLYDLIVENGIDVIVSNPVKTKAIASAKIKNDKLDSYMLAQLLRSDLVATVHVSSRQTRKIKEILRHRNRLVRDAARLKNRIRTVLAKNNCQVTFKNLFGVNGRQCLKQISLSTVYRSQVDTYMTIYDHLSEQIQPLTNQIYQMSKEHPVAQRLMSIPGIGPIVAMTIIAEVEDISRFASYRKLASYAGLVPSLDASGDKTRTGRITKQGSRHLRTALIEAAQTIPRVKRSRLNIFFRKRIVKSGYQKAIVATAHKILQYVYYIWKNQTTYREFIPASA